jgi:hypothetical protein
MLIPIVAIIAGITSGIFAMYFKYRTRQRFFRDREKLIDAMRETGELDTEKLKQFQDPKLFEGLAGFDEDKSDRKGNLKAGIILIAVALALWLFMALFIVGSEGENAALQTVALFPGFLGLAFIFIHFTCQPKDNNGRNKD